ncbi:dienelactone hydrolase family protein [Mucilaginibacter sp. UR6-1]|uniref:alpha/beta hydrolase n=1 Tax=Mucilaginibacter sp. UR6-1 TaxID=1435643 RepID=UPI001E60AEBD|nr:dienelactone hydrolase family protein [Mucilaginibacter sp. UR6-1]MCC8407581.1 dienelactone hydrolase family protein [Mucilaginibacter sp. UR6-1]
MYTHQKQYITAGKPIAEAGGALIMIHGRGGTAENIISLAEELNAGELAIYAPQASNHSWYPYSFMAADNQNQPALNSAIEVIGELVEEIVSKGIPAEKIYFLGFSQGACLTLEYIARNAKQYGGAVAFTGGLIGQQLDVSKYTGDLNGTPVLITTGDPDPHVPLTRVEESVALLKKLNADVNVTVFNGRPHTIIQQEIDLADKYVFR